MITIHGMPRSRSTRALWALEEAGLEYVFEPLDAMKGALRSADYLALNPGGKVPTLVDDSGEAPFVLTESGAIVTYIGQQVPERGLVPPAGTHAHGHYLQWVCFVISELEQPLWTISKHSFALPEKLRVPDIKPTATKEFARAVGVLAQGLEGREYLVGDTFTMADVLAAHTLVWATRMYQLELPESVAAYGQRMRSRPALARAIAREEAARARGITSPADAAARG
jgi:glutathione S-transferase